MKVFVTRPIDDAGVAVLEAAGLEVRVSPHDRALGRDELLAGVDGAAGLLSMLSDRVDGPVFDRGPLRVVGNHAVGVDNVDLAAAKARGVIVTNTPDVLTDATADCTLGLVIAAARRFGEAERLLREGRFLGWGPLMLRGLELRGARLGIVGFGRIGQAVARRALAFGCEVVHHSRTSGLPLEELLRTSDVVSIHCPLTPQTRHLIGERELGWMKRTAVLVNTARGPVVDEAALARALAAGTIAAAGLDVYEDEPRVHEGLLRLPNVVLLPHIGSATVATRRAMAVRAAEGIRDVLLGRDPAHRVA